MEPGCQGRERVPLSQDDKAAFYDGNRHERDADEKVEVACSQT